MKRLLILLFVLVTTLKVTLAQSIGSFVYLETIKGLPCKIILNNVEIPNLAKTHYLFALSKVGENTIDIVFGADLYPKQSIVIDAIENASYGFKLAKTQEDKFYLIDLVNTGKIVEPNTDINIALSTEDNKIRYFDPNNLPLESEAVTKSNSKKNKREKQTEIQTSALPDTSKQEQKYGVVSIIEPNNEVPVATAEVKDKPKSIPPIADKPKARPVCKSLSSEEEVANAIQQLNSKKDDEAKLIILKRKPFTGCLTTEQVVSLAETVDNQFNRFNAVKYLSRFISDFDKIQDLQKLFRSEAYKKKVLEL